MKSKLKKEEDFPALGPNKIAADGFEHMVEVVESEPNTAEEKMIKKDIILKVDPNDFEYNAENDTVNAILQH